MAGTTFRIPIFGASTLPDTSGNITPEPSAVNLLANDLYQGLVFKAADSGTKVTLGGAFKVPQNYAGTPKFGIFVATTATTGDWQYDVDYRTIVDNDSVDPTTHEESITGLITVPGTARLADIQELAATAGNFSAGDSVFFLMGRDGAQAADTLAAGLYIFPSLCYFSYVD
jgi:hypothetical protein